MNASSVGDLDSTDASSELLCASPVPNSMESSYYSYQLDAAIGGEVGGEAVPVPALRPARGEHRDDDADLAPARRPENGLKAGKAQSAAVSAAATDSDPVRAKTPTAAAGRGSAQCAIRAHPNIIITWSDRLMGRRPALGAAARGDQEAAGTNRAGPAASPPRAWRGVRCWGSVAYGGTVRRQAPPLEGLYG